MLKGQELIAKIIELDGLSREDVMHHCGFEEDNYLLTEEFYLSVSKFAESYVNALSNLRKRQLSEGKQVTSDIILKRFEGGQLLSRVETLDESFEPGPPWSKKMKIVIKCGYVRLKKNGDIQVEYQEFHDAYTQAIDEREMSEEAGFGHEEATPLQLSDSSLRIVKPGSDDLLDQAAYSLIKLSRCIRESTTSQRLSAIRIEYDGEGDDGEICSVTFLFAASSLAGDPEDCDHKVKLLPENILFDGNTLSRQDYERQIERFSFSITYNCHGSWFNQYGGSGFLFIDINSSTLLGCHYQNEDPEGFPGYQEPYASPYFIAIHDV